MKRRYIKPITITERDVALAEQQIKYMSIVRCCPVVQALKRVWKCKSISCGFTEAYRGARCYSIDVAGQQVMFAHRSEWREWIGTSFVVEREV